MKLKDSLGKVVMVATLFLSSPGFTQQPKDSSNQKKVNEPIIYYFGVRTNAEPISYTDGIGNPQGYCYAFIETLKAQKNLNIEPVFLTREKRFTSEGNEGKKLDAECGPNTITLGRTNKQLKENGREGKFSEPFAWTGVKALLLDKNKLKFQNERQVQELKLGVIRGTTTEQLVKTMYPLSVINNNIKYVTEHNDGINKIKNERIDVYFNDELILKSTLIPQFQKHGINYYISPELLSHEQYGIIIYHTSQEKNIQLLNAINSLLREAEVKTFGNTQLKILNSPEFKDFLENENLHEDNWLDSLSYFRVKILYVLAIIFVIILFLLINTQINRTKRSRGISQTRTQRNNNSDIRNNEESRVAPLKSEDSPTTPHIIVNNHNNLHSKNDNTQGDNMSDRKTQINQNNSSFGVGYSEQVEANQVAANIHNYAPEQDLAQAAARIQELLKQLEKTNPTATQEDKQAFINLAIPQEEKSRVVRALQAGGEKALEKFLNNPYVDVTMAIVKEWQKGQE
ncbi:type 2 periplasmic-binding domain-containing protein [Mastigocladopsis repens]|uniref:transporter substrate-binding domain-containing protein n=1 Tax=Mastigocladopsis repens TaxID=221287 RepID=UPI000378550F|nr:transporter substrate-binding domain-containing protein [Mastigocladopsis repens]